MGTTTITVPQRKLSNLHVRSLEEEIMLIQESEERGGEMSAEEAYVKGLEFLKNLGK